MTKKIKISFLSLVILVFVLTGFMALAQNRSLELTYPAISGSSPPSNASTLPDYVKYIFDFAIGICGFAGFASLVLGGIKFLTSAGDPGKASDAKSQILSALFGAVLLLGSVILFNMINPAILTFSMPKIEAAPEGPLPTPAIYSVPTRDLTERLKKMAEELKAVPIAIKSTGQQIKTLTDACDCQNTKATCACEGDNGKDAKCKEKTCLTGNDSHPCKAKDQIKQFQKNIIDHKDLLMYYKERIVSERADLLNDIATIITANITWYDGVIRLHQDIQSKRSGALADMEATIIASLQSEKTAWEDERQNKLQLAILLQMLGDPIDKLAQPAQALPQQSDKCLANVGEKCKPSCKKGEDYGCHDKVKGCMPDKCSGGNPCPTSEIQNQLGKMDSPAGQIVGLCQAIISTVDSITKERQIKGIEF